MPDARQSDWTCAESELHSERHCVARRQACGGRSRRGAIRNVIAPPMQQRQHGNANTCADDRTGQHIRCPMAKRPPPAAMYGAKPAPSRSSPRATIASASPVVGDAPPEFRRAQRRARHRDFRNSGRATSNCRWQLKAPLHAQSPIARLLGDRSSCRGRPTESARSRSRNCTAHHRSSPNRGCTSGHTRRMPVLRLCRSILSPQYLQRHPHPLPHQFLL